LKGFYFAGDGTKHSPDALTWIARLVVQIACHISTLEMYFPIVCAAPLSKEVCRPHLL
jgi:hypothetical protein